ncbi:hypothetical protein FJ987_05445 [Mesorhizobium sp. CU2]|uniref:hypothetical protein n=1 Tax=unclassified Mesorhizobium TaxID=325217 RepID=UPI001125FFAF|nr:MULTISPECIES: hypothetical protein [unclassified Mesorhizobium]TPN89853.1 hypothetical protein FJ988_02805 [Mesorhizobium sp. CU3]TPO20303.1 hypothetical protein FJ987_05445 [Mesorhizobium sp. CU2]
MLRTLLALWLAAFVAVGAGWARTPTDIEKQALSATVEEFKAAFGANDMGHVFGMTSPKILDYIATSSGLTIDQLQTQMQAAWADVQKRVTVESFRMDLAAVRYLEREDGTPYAFLPTETVMSVDKDGHKQRFVAHSQTLALLEGSQWYLVRVDEPKQLTIVRKIYPEFEKVEFPQGTMEALD